MRNISRCQHWPQKLNMSIEIVALAVGWLAAEDKVYIGENRGIIELSPKNRHPIYFG